MPFYDLSRWRQCLFSFRTQSTTAEKENEDTTKKTQPFFKISQFLSALLPTFPLFSRPYFQPLPCHPLLLLSFPDAPFSHVSPFPKATLLWREAAAQGTLDTLLGGLLVELASCSCISLETLRCPKCKAAAVKKRGTLPKRPNDQEAQEAQGGPGTFGAQEKGRRRAEASRAAAWHLQPPEPPSRAEPSPGRMRMAGEPPSPAQEPAAASNGRERCKDFHPAPEIQGDIPMGSERTEMRKRQTSVTQETPSSIQAQPDVDGRDSNACCFCWCCCCSCSCLTVRNQDERTRTASHELRTDTIPNSEESSTPTVEDVNTWAQSFDKLMRTPAGRNAFREFLRTEFSEENMLFWMACEELKRESNKNLIEAKARLIYEDYISILSPKEVSLDSRVREVINRNMLEPSQHTFDDAQLQIYTLMHRDSYPRFMNSAVYKDLVQSVSETSAEA